MMSYVYILKSLKDNGYYIGSTTNLEDRIKRHKEGRSLATKGRLPVELVYIERYDSYREAVKSEFEIKRKKSKKYIEYLIQRARSSVGRASAF